MKAKTRRSANHVAALPQDERDRLAPQKEFPATVRATTSYRQPDTFQPRRTDGCLRTSSLVQA